MCVVGDDAQSIYSFRGANIRNILDLSKSFPNLRTFKLEENYRSTQNIIGAANSLIAVNKEQIPKNVFSNKETGDPIEVSGTYNDYEEARAVAARLMQVKRRLSLDFSDIAILYRTNAQSRVLEEALRDRNIVYRVYGGLGFYQRKEVKDALAYFRLSVNPDDDEALVRVINTPKRGIGDTTVKKLRDEAISAGVSIFDVIINLDRYGLKINKGTRAKLTSFANLIEGFVVKVSEDTDALSIANEILESTGLVKQYLTENTPENISKFENLQELQKAVTDFTARTKGSPENNSMSDFLAQVSLLTDQDTDNTSDSKVTLMTMHAAKGLEFGAVFIVGAEENLIPSDKCSTLSDIEEERRLMYVAITRAKQYCQISFARQRTINGKQDKVSHSRFLSDIAPRYLRLMTGTRLERRSTHEAKQPAPPRFRTVVSTEPVKVAKTIGATPKPIAGSNSPHTSHDVKELSQGMEIQHPLYGKGQIVKIIFDETGNRIIVGFDDGVSRTILLKFARFTILK